MSRWIALFVVLGACGPAYRSEQGQLEFDGAGMRDPGDGTDPHPVLAGGLVCTSGSALRSCFRETFEGGERVDTNCFRVDEDRTEVVWSFVPAGGCAVATEAPLVPDRVVYAVVPVDDDLGVRLAPIEADLEILRIDGGEGDPPVWTPGEPVPIASEGAFAFGPGLERSGEAVAFAEADVSFALADVTGDPRVERQQARAVVSGAPGDAGTVWMEALGGEWEVNPFRIVDVAEATSIEVIAAGMEIDHRVVPMAARAVVRDGRGEPIYGAPVVWEADGLELEPGLESGLPGDDYVLIGAGQDPEAASEGTLTARLGDLSATVDVAWDPAPPPAEWGEEEAPRGDCGCDSSGATLGWSGLVAALAVWRRRRQRR